MQYHVHRERDKEKLHSHTCGYQCRQFCIAVTLANTWSCNYWRRFLWEIYLCQSKWEGGYAPEDRSDMLSSAAGMSVLVIRLLSTYRCHHWILKYLEYENKWNICMAKSKTDVVILSEPQVWIFKLNLISVVQMMDKTKASAVKER